MVNPKIITEIVIIAVDRMGFSWYLNDFIPMNKLNKPIIKHTIAPNILFIFGKIAPKNRIKNTTCRPIQTRSKFCILGSPQLF